MFRPSPRVLSSSSVDRYDDASTTLPRGDGAEQVLGWGSSFPPSRPLSIKARKVNPGFIRPENLGANCLKTPLFASTGCLHLPALVCSGNNNGCLKPEWRPLGSFNLLCNRNFGILLCLPATLPVSSGGSSSVLMVWFSPCETIWRQLCVSCCWTDGRSSRKRICCSDTFVNWWPQNLYVPC